MLFLFLHVKQTSIIYLLVSIIIKMNFIFDHQICIHIYITIYIREKIYIHRRKIHFKFLFYNV